MMMNPSESGHFHANAAQLSRQLKCLSAQLSGYRDCSRKAGRSEQWKNDVRVTACFHCSILDIIPKVFIRFAIFFLGPDYMEAG